MSERPSVLGRLGGHKQVSRSEENVSCVLGSATVVTASHEEKKKERINLSSIDGILTAPEMIEIPDRYKPEVRKGRKEM